jgi:hypothetical protein
MYNVRTGFLFRIGGGRGGVEGRWRRKRRRRRRRRRRGGGGWQAAARQLVSLWASD